MLCVELLPLRDNPSQLMDLVIVDRGPQSGQPADTSTCNYALLTGREAAALNSSPLNLSSSEGAALAVAILSVWGVAFAWRAVARALGGGDGAFSTEESSS